MKRRNLFEFGDQPWLPAFLRDAMTDYLATAYRLSPLPGVWAEVIERVLKETGSEEIVDLCSGSGGPMSLVVAELRRRGCHAEVTLTDLHVRQRHGTGGIRYWPQAVNALSVPTGLEGLRTMFAVFHHFAPGEASGILQSAVAAHCPIAIFEATSRSVAAIVSSILIPPLTLLLTPAIRPVSWRQLVCTYLVPILPVLIFWDGLVSHLRTYTKTELESMMSQCAAQNYRWTVSTVPMRGVPDGLPYVIGMPLPSEAG